MLQQNIDAGDESKMIAYFKESSNPVAKLLEAVTFFPNAKSPWEKIEKGMREVKFLPSIKCKPALVQS